MSPNGQDATDGEGGGGAVYRWYVIGLLGVIYFVAFADRLALSLLIEPIKRDLHISDTAIGLLFGLSFAGTLALISIPVGRFADRGNRRDLIALAVGAWSLMTALAGLTRSFGMLLFCRVGLAVGEAGLSPAALSMISDLFPAAKRPLPLAVYLTAGIAGASGSLLVLGAVLHAVTGMPPFVLPGFGVLAPWRMTLIAVGLPTTALALLLRSSVREPARAADHLTQGPIWEAFTYLRAHARAHLGFFAGGALMALLSLSATTWYPTYLIREHHMTAHQVGALLGAVSIVTGVTGSLLVPAMATAAARRRTGALRLAAMLAIGLGAPLFILGLHASNVAWSMAFMGAAQFCLIGGINIPAVMIQQTAPSHLRAQLGALYFVGVNLGGLGTAPVLVPVVARLAFNGDHGLAPAMASLAIMAWPVALLVLLSLRPDPQTAA